jgi:hypothetical protein
MPVRWRLFKHLLVLVKVSSHMLLEHGTQLCCTMLAEYEMVHWRTVLESSC